MNRKNSCAIFLVGIITLLTTACFPRAVDLDQKTYMFSVPTQKPFSAMNDATLQINEPTITSGFSDSSFVYRTSAVAYTRDYYNVFFVPANQQVLELLTTNFQDANVFSDVEPSGSLSSVTYVLKSNITALYADYRNLQQPKAMLAIDIALYKQNRDSTKLLLQHSYNEATLIQPKDSHGLVVAWSTDLTLAISQIMRDVDGAVKKDILATAKARANQNQ